MSMIRFEYESALNSLVAEYKDYDPEATIGELLSKGLKSACPLCKTDALLSKKQSGCRTCPWVVMTSKTCLENRYYNIKIKDRLVQLEYWLEETGVEALNV